MPAQKASPAAVQSQLQPAANAPVPAAPGPIPVVARSKARAPAPAPEQAPPPEPSAQPPAGPQPAVTEPVPPPGVPGVALKSGRAKPGRPAQASGTAQAGRQAARTANVRSRGRSAAIGCQAGGCGGEAISQGGKGEAVSGGRQRRSSFRRAFIRPSTGSVTAWNSDAIRSPGWTPTGSLSKGRTLAGFGASRKSAGSFTAPWTHSPSPCIATCLARRPGWRRSTSPPTDGVRSAGRYRAGDPVLSGRHTAGLPSA